LCTIPADSPVGEAIRDFRKKSKLGQKEELLLEHKRNSLIRSGNPWDLEAARKIVTPASIYEDMKADEHHEIAADSESAGLGEIPASEGNIKEVVKEAVQEMDPEGISTDELSARLINRLKHTNFESEVIIPKKDYRVEKKKVISLWRPLTFPKIPEKVCRSPSPPFLWM
jgi:DNA-directed RNA polymerase